MGHFVPSSWLLGHQIDAAMAKFDADREQYQLRKEERENERAARAWMAEVEAKRRARQWGPR